MFHVIDQWVVHVIDQWGGSCDWSVGVIPVINQWSDLSD
jgi:hypothetical protein